MLVRHLASMSTGHTTDMWEPVVRGGLADPVRSFLRLPPPRDPGSVFAYNQPATYTLAAIVQRRTGQTLLDWLRPRLLDPLGIGPASWQEHPPGRQLGFSGLHATTDAVARLGQLYLQRGAWDGRQLLPETWVEQATAVHVPTPHEGDVDWRQGYGLQVWRSRHGYRGDGAYGQLCLVLPEQDAVVAVTGQSSDMQRVLDAVWTHLLPALDAGDSSTTDDAVLAERLAGLSLSGSPGAPAPAAAVADRWAGAAFVPGPGVRQEQSTTTAVRVERDDDGWSVVLTDAGQDLGVRTGPEAWTTSTADVPVAATGGWLDEDTLELAVAFLESPHRLVLTCRSGDGTFRLRWATPPLGGGPLRTLRAPWSPPA